MENAMRLQKYLSECGVASRRKSEELIRNRVVKVNGLVAQLGDKVDPHKDKVTVHGKAVHPVKEKCYLMLHKPRGYVTTMSDEQGRKCVADLVKDAPAKVYPVGRLDRDSEGLLLMTNDGEFSNRLMHPRSHVSKSYRVTVRSSVTEDMLTQLMTGVVLDGRKTAPCEVEVLEKREDRTVLKFVLYEGRNREIRRMCEAVGLEVLRLKRIAVDTLKLGMLPQGKWRELTEQEVKKLILSATKSEYRQQEGNERYGSRKAGSKRSGNC